MTARRWVVFAVAFVTLILLWEALVSHVIQPALGSDITVSGSATGGVAAHSRTEYMPCSGNDTERNCVWDQLHGGAGDGFSWSFFVDKAGNVFRLPHHIAHYLIYGGDQ